MQRPKAPPAYPKFDGAVSKGMLEDYQKRKQALEQLKAAQKPDKATIARLTEELELKGRAVEAHLMREMAGLQKNHAEHLRRIEAWQQECKKYLVLAKKRLDLYQAKGQRQDYDIAMTAEAVIRQVLDIAEQDDAQYGKAWLFYRTTNMVSAYDFDNKFAEGVNTGIGQLMAEGKEATLRIKKMESYVVQADAIQKAAERIRQKGGREAEQSRTEAQALAKKMDDLLKGMVEADKTGLHGMKGKAERLTATAKKKSEAIKVPLKNWEGFYADLGTTVRTWKTQVKAMQTTLAAGKKGFEQDELNDTEVKKSLVAADKSLKEAEGTYKFGEAAMKQATSDIKVIRTFFKK
jgi:hypothetical protein